MIAGLILGLVLGANIGLVTFALFDAGKKKNR